MYKHIIETRAAHQFHSAIQFGILFVISVLIMLGSVWLIFSVANQYVPVFASISALSCVSLIPVACITFLDTRHSVRQYRILKRGLVCR